MSKVWVTREGQEIPIKDIPDSHLAAIVAMLLRKERALQDACGEPGLAADAGWARDFALRTHRKAAAPLIKEAARRQRKHVEKRSPKPYAVAPAEPPQRVNAAGQPYDTEGSL